MTPFRPLALCALLLAAPAPCLAASDKDAAQAEPLALSEAQAPLSMGAVSIWPPRVILDARGRGALQIYNRSSAPQSYEADLVEYAVAPDGSYREATEEGAAAWSLAPFVKFGPRRVTLDPGESQTIRIALGGRRPEGGADRRSHLRISAAAAVDPAGRPSAKGAPLVAMRMGLSAPVVWQSSPLAARDLAVHLRRTEAGLVEATITPQSSGSWYGALTLRGKATGALVASQPLNLHQGTAERRILFAGTQGLSGAQWALEIASEQGETDHRLLDLE